MPHSNEPCPPSLRVDVLGPTMINTPEPRSDRARALTSLCVWLALHPDAAGCQLDRAFGMSAQSRTSALSRLRAWLGADIVPPVRPAGRYRLEAATDWTKVQQLVCTTGGRLHDKTDTADLIAALALVRSEPLADMSAAWADAERIQMSLLLADIAIRLIRRHAYTRPDVAAWALGRGMAAAPEDDRLRQLARRLHQLQAGRVA